MLQHRFYKTAPNENATTKHRGFLSAADKLKVNQLDTEVAWTDIPMDADWESAGVYTPVPQYCRTALGEVQLRYMACKSSALALPDTIGTLPAGFRPPYTCFFSVASLGAVYTEVRISTAGVITLNVGGSDSGVVLDGIHFTV